MSPGLTRHGPGSGERKPRAQAVYGVDSDHGPVPGSRNSHRRSQGRARSDHLKGPALAPSQGRARSDHFKGPALAPAGCPLSPLQWAVMPAIPAPECRPTARSQQQPPHPCLRALAPRSALGRPRRRGGPGGLPLGLTRRALRACMRDQGMTRVKRQLVAFGLLISML